jgi:phospholipid transport system substrate-binding protein
MIRRSFLALAVLCAVAFAAPSRAQGQDPAQFINEMGQKALAALTSKSSSSAELQQRFRTLLNANFDVPTIARYALGRYWNVATPQQQQEYRQLFEDQIVDAYATRFREYTGEQFKVTTSRQEGNDTVVSSQIIRPAGGPPIDVDWRVRHGSQGLRIIDVAVSGVSMARTQQQEFAAVIERNGGNVDALIQALRSKTVGVAKPGRT